MNNNFLGIRGLYKTHMDELKPFNSKSVTYTYIGYTEHNSRGQPIVWHFTFNESLNKCIKKANANTLSDTSKLVPSKSSIFTGFIKITKKYSKSHRKW